jgi:hypothetical protein
MDPRSSQESSETETPGADASPPRVSWQDLEARLETWNERAKRFIRERPAACLLGAMALGYVVARLARKGR